MHICWRPKSTSPSYLSLAAELPGAGRLLRPTTLSSAAPATMMSIKNLLRIPSAAPATMITIKNLLQIPHMEMMRKTFLR